MTVRGGPNRDRCAHKDQIMDASYACAPGVGLARVRHLLLELGLFPGLDIQ
jgi:hypothetical protein